MTGAFLHHERERSPKARIVVLSGNDLEDAARLMKLLTEGSHADVVGLTSAGQPQAVSREALIEAARQELEKRRRRPQFLPEGMFGEAAWEILLQLYIEQQGVRLNIARLSGNLGVPLTSALRWLSYLQDRNLVGREDHPTDQRSVFLKLTTKGIGALDAYFSDALIQES